MTTILDSLRSLGAKDVHVRRVRERWLAGRDLDEPERGHERFPRAVREALSRVRTELDALATVESEHPAEDGGARMLLRLSDGRTVESVLLPRDGVCVSTQVGCAVGCTFCMTGTLGLERQLTSEEILAQVVAARRRRRLRRVVFMGMGEPAHNLPAVLEALTHLGGAGRFGHKELVFSTVGEPRVFERLAAHDVKPALALSLHSTDPERRARLLPRAPRIEPRAVLDLAIDYAEGTGHPLQLQWTLLAGVNDGDDEVETLGDWLAGRRVVVNFIPYNDVPGLDHERTPYARVREMSRALFSRGILVKVRRSVAGEVDGACGQLRARST
jgi:23S rRNA (adenine2503-C2)-methyltransferase